MPDSPIVGAHSATRSDRAWHLITGEYPPQIGGVADYTRELARAIASTGREVHVWCGTPPGTTDDAPDTARIHREFGSFSPCGLWSASRNLRSFPGSKLLFVQYVPHAFGYRSVNVLFIVWLVWQRLKGDEIWVMFHEVAFPFTPRGVKKNVLAVVHRVMAACLISIATRIFASTAAWVPLLKSLSLTRRPATLLPVFSNAPHQSSQARLSQIRREIFGDCHDQIIGHFGTYSTSVTDLLTPVLCKLLQHQTYKVLLIGRGAQEYATRLRKKCVPTQGAVAFLENATPEQISLYLQTCDVMLQPYPDGITTRRSSAMACLAHGIATVTTTGTLSEEFWSREPIALTAPVGDTELLVKHVLACLKDVELKSSVGEAGKAYYSENFSIEATLAGLLPS